MDSCPVDGVPLLFTLRVHASGFHQTPAIKEIGTQEELDTMVEP